MRWSNWRAAAEEWRRAADRWRDTATRWERISGLWEARAIAAERRLGESTPATSSPPPPPPPPPGINPTTGRLSQIPSHPDRRPR